MNKTIKLTLLSCLMAFAVPMQAKQAEKVASPDGRLTLSAGVDKQGRPYYELRRDTRPVINRSLLGFQLKEGNLDRDFRVTLFQRRSFDETWTQPWGEETDVRNQYNELRMNLQGRNGLRRQINIVFRVFDDGIGFRYEFPAQKSLTEFVITDEKTEYVLPWDAPAWTISREANYFEELWKKTPVSQKELVASPVTMEVNDSLYLVFHEANLTDFASLGFAAVKKEGSPAALKAALVPWSNGDLVRTQAPSVSPWRTIIVGSKPGDLVLSRLMLNLNEPCKIEDTSWLETGKYVGIWWGMHMKDYTWEQGPKHGATTENTRRYIDFAAKHGFKGVLVEGWNWGWDGDWTKEGDKFSFTKAYPDYDLEGVQEYALSKGVRIIAHNETGGAAKNYENQLEEAFTLYQKLGIRSIKTGYVNALMDDKELQRSQYGVRHYRKVIEAAARHQIMVVNHEPAMPTGLQRTYPNLISGEGVRGQEWNAWSTDGGNPPSHLCIIPFTRQLAGPIDFTPGVFNYTNKAVPHTHAQTTLAKQLAEYVVVYAPWQMACDMIENYENQPALAFIESVATNWQKTIILNAEIGKYITTARQARETGDWFIGGMTDEEARDMTLSLSFLEPGKTYKAIIYKDGPDADYKTNPYPLTILQQKVTTDTKLDLHLQPSGGFAIQIKACTE